MQPATEAKCVLELQFMQTQTTHQPLQLWPKSIFRNKKQNKKYPFIIPLLGNSDVPAGSYRDTENKNAIKDSITLYIYEK